MIDYIKNSAKDYNIKNNKNKLLKKIFANKYTSINIFIILEINFVNKTIEIFIK